MRVHSTFEVNTQQQPNPYLAQHAGSGSPGETASGISFDECLRSYYQQANAPAVTRQTESQIAGLFWGYHPSLKAPSKPEPALKGGASYSTSEL